MRIGFEAKNNVDEDGAPAGGSVKGTGFDIEWQNGPVGRVGSAERVAPTGAFVEDVIAAALQRIHHYQDGQFRCRENSIAITKLEEALMWLDSRTKRRVEQNVEGTHEGS